jgi:hypothetical protein
MKIRYVIMILCACVCSLILISCNNDSNLLEMTYDAPQSAVTMSLEGEKYFLTGAAPYNIQKDQKIAMVKPEKNLPNSYVYTIKGYNGRDFLIVEERTVGVVLCIYAHETINNIPWELLVGNFMLDGNEYIKFSDKNYYYFSKTSSDFLVDKELSQIKRDDKAVSVYKIHGIPESEWIAIKDVSFYKEGYMLYWIRGTSVPREYIESWRTYGK